MYLVKTKQGKVKATYLVDKKQPSEVESVISSLSKEEIVIIIYRTF